MPVEEEKRRCKCLSVCKKCLKMERELLLEGLGLMDARPCEENLKFQDQPATFQEEKEVLCKRVEKQMTDHQEKRPNLYGDQEDTTQLTGKDKATLENQLASCKEENESLRQHMKKMEEAYQEERVKLLGELESLATRALEEKEERADLAYKVEKAKAESNDSKYQLEICRVKVHTLHQEKEKETFDRQKEQAKLAVEVVRAGAEMRFLEHELQTCLKEIDSLRQQIEKETIDHQEERVTLAGEAEWAGAERTYFEHELETCLKETGTLSQQNEKETLDHQSCSGDGWWRAYDKWNYEFELHNSNIQE